nr:inositol-phosphate phosphatase [Tanacetum cinerariifolium]
HRLVGGRGQPHHRTPQRRANFLRALRRTHWARGASAGGAAVARGSGGHAGLQKLFPEAGFVTEEGTVANSDDSVEYRWIIDPLDGTTNFIHGLPCFAVSVALARGVVPVLGVVYEEQQLQAALRKTPVDTAALLQQFAPPGAAVEQAIRREDPPARAANDTGWTIYPPLVGAGSTQQDQIAATRSAFGKTRTRTARDLYDL